MTIVPKSNFNITIVILIVCLTLQACGFTPVYQEGSSTERALSGIILEDPQSKAEYDFLKAVEDIIPRPSQPSYKVKYRAWTKLRGVPVRGVPRRQIVGKLNFEVVSLQTEQTILSDRIETFTSFTDEGDLRAPQKEDAMRRAMQVLADRFVDTLMVRSSILAKSLP